MGAAGLASMQTCTVPQVLIADDDAEMRMMLASALRDDGCDVVQVDDGAQVVTHLSAAPDDFSLVVCDVRMLACGGLEVLGFMRSIACKVPLILMTAFGDPDLRRQIEEAGACLFDKPFDLDDLRTAVGRFVARPDVRLVTTRDNTLDAWAIKWMLEANGIRAVLRQHAQPIGWRSDVYVRPSDAARACAIIASEERSRT
ncbi:MAG TPA: response regulator [Polyangiaceae bacterium]